MKGQRGIAAAFPFVFFIALFCAPPCAFPAFGSESAQTAAQTAAQPAARDATLIPQIVYVGDRARLIVPLDSSTVLSGLSSVVIDQRESLPKSASVLIHRFEIERRPGAVRALIDFTAFAPGEVPLPTLELGGVRLSGLRVKITSVLEKGATELSPPEDPLTAPGTYLLIYGAVLAVLAAGAGTVFFIAKGLPLLSAYLERRRRGLAAKALRRVLARLESEGSTMDRREFLTVLFKELRGYLTYRTGANCLALTARELPSALAADSIAPRFSPEDLSFLEELFRRGDAVRFGAASVSETELRDALRGVGELVDRAEAAVC